MRQILVRLKYGLQASSFLFLVIIQGMLINLPKSSANAPYLASDVLGQSDLEGYHSNGGTTITGHFNTPWNVKIDTIHHRLFVVDGSNHRILVYNLNSSNQLVDKVADYVLGQPNFVNTSQDTNSSGFKDPRDVYYDSTNDRLIVDDYGNNRILFFDVATITNNEAAVAVLGQANYTTGSAVGCNWAPPTTAAGLCNPISIILDSANHLLYISDQSNSRIVIHQLDTDNLPIDTTADYVLGQANLTSTGSDTTAKGFSSQTYMHYDSVTDYLYVSDGGNKRVLIFDVSTIINNEDAIYVLGQADFTSSGGDINAKGFGYPQGLTLDPDTNYLYVSDWDNAANNRVLIFDVSTIINNEDAIYVLGQSNFTSSGADTNAKGFSCPAGLNIDTANNLLYAAECNNHRVLIFDVSAIVNNEDATDVLGQDNFTSNDNVNNVDFTTSASGFSTPYDQTIDTINHRMYVVDKGNNRVVVYNLDSSDVPLDGSADYVVGQANFTSKLCGGDDTPLTAATLCNPTSVALDAVNHRLFVGDGNSHRVVMYNLDSTNVPLDGTADYVFGQVNFTTGLCNNGGSSTATTLCVPDGLALDQVNHRLLIADAGNSRVVMYNLDSTNAPLDNTGDYVIGQDDLVGGTCNDAGVPLAGRLCFVNKLLFDTVNHRLFIGDYANNRVVIHNLDSTNLPLDASADYVIGQADFTTSLCGGDDVLLAANNMCHPYGIALDSTQHKLFVSDFENGRVVVYDLDSSNVPIDTTADNVLGKSDFTTGACGGGGTSATASTICYPAGLWNDATNNRVFLADSGSNRVLIFTLINLPASVDSGTVGSSYSSTVAASQSQGTVSYALASGSLPAGVTLNSSTGTLTGTPTTVGDYSFSITATDNNGAIGSFTDTKSYVLGIAAAASTGSGSTVTNTIKKVVSFAQSLFDDTTDEVVVTDTADLPSTPTTSNSRPTPAPTIDPEATDLTLVWWLGGGISLFLILIGLGVLVLKKSKSEN